MICSLKMFRTKDQAWSADGSDFSCRKPLLCRTMHQEKKQSQTYSGCSYLLVIRLYSNRLSCTWVPCRKNQPCTHPVPCCWGCDVCSVLIIQFCNAEEGVTDRFGRSLVQLDAGGTVQGGWQMPWHKLEEHGDVDSSSMCVCDIYIYSIYEWYCMLQSLPLWSVHMNTVWLVSRHRCLTFGCIPGKLCEDFVLYCLWASCCSAATYEQSKCRSGQMTRLSGPRRRRRRSVSVANAPYGDSRRARYHYHILRYITAWLAIAAAYKWSCFFSPAHIDSFAEVMNKRSSLVKSL